MALRLKNRVKETTVTTGTGSVLVAGAASGFQTFASALADGDTTYYQITDGTDWEIGEGTWDEANNELARTSVFESSNSGSKVNWGAGAKDVFIVMPAQKVHNTDVYAQVSDMPLTGNSAGDQAYVTSNNNLYIWDGNGWYKIAAVNQTPTVSGNDATYPLATDGTATVVTLTGTDPEGFPVTWSATTSGDTAAATVTNVDNVFTITPSTNEADAGTLVVTFSASDGTNIGTASSDFTLVFATDWTALTQYQEIPSEIPQNYGSFGGGSKGISEDGSVFAIGMQGYDIGGVGGVGQAYVYKDTGSGYSKVATLGPDSNVENTYFGSSVDISGNWLLIGCRGENNGKGAIYFYNTADNGSTWTFSQKITVTTEGANDHFGWGVSISGDYACACVPYDNSSRGRLYVYNYNGTSWTQVQRIDGNQTNGTLGDSGSFRGVALSKGNNAIYLAYRQKNASTGFGEVIVMKKTGTHTYSQQQSIPAPSANTQNTYFGDSLKISGDTLTFGSRSQKYMPTNTSTVGAWYVYVTTNAGSTWTKELEQIPPEGVVGSAEYGSSVDIDGDVAVVGRFSYDTPSLTNVGNFEVWKRDAGVWTLQNSYLADNPVAYDRFGNGVTISEAGGLVVAGATDRLAGYAGEGTVIIFK